MVCYRCGIWIRRQNWVYLLVICVTALLIMLNKYTSDLTKKSVLTYVRPPIYSQGYNISEDRVYKKVNSFGLLILENDVIGTENRKTGHVVKYGQILQTHKWKICGEGKEFQHTGYPKLILGSKKKGMEERHKEKEKERIIEPSATNRTNGHILIYNRVGKCGSETFISILSNLQLTIYNNFEYCHSYVYERRHFTVKMEEDFLDWVFVKQTMNQRKRGFAMDRHFFFVDVNNYNVKKGKLK